jgi:hypothetical protein
MSPGESAQCTQVGAFPIITQWRSTRKPQAEELQISSGIGRGKSLKIQGELRRSKGMRALFCAASANNSPTAFLILAAVVGILIFGAVLYRFVIKESRQNNTQAMFLSVIALALVGAPVWSTISLKFGKVGVDLEHGPCTK